SHRDSNLQNCNVYIGNLSQHVNRAVLEQAFGIYGPLHRVWVAQKPPGFAFVEFEKPHDAAAAVQGLNGKTLCGRQIRVEFSFRQRRRKHINMHELAPASRNYGFNRKPSRFVHSSQVTLIPSALRIYFCGTLELPLCNIPICRCVMSLDFTKIKCWNATRFLSSV
uniref:RRM domain-containing protein n=1 Tax=Xenopus tropicalis TaxID=8364 RepID=A0A6I8QYW4_XENTR